MTLGPTADIPGIQLEPRVDIKDMNRRTTPIGVSNLTKPNDSQAPKEPEANKKPEEAETNAPENPPQYSLEMIEEADKMVNPDLAQNIPLWKKIEIIRTIRDLSIRDVDGTRNHEEGSQLFLLSRGFRRLMGDELNAPDGKHSAQTLKRFVELKKIFFKRCCGRLGLQKDLTKFETVLDKGISWLKARTGEETASTGEERSAKAGQPTEALPPSRKDREKPVYPQAPETPSSPRVPPMSELITAGPRKKPGLTVSRVNRENPANNIRPVRLVYGAMEGIGETEVATTAKTTISPEAQNEPGKGQGQDLTTDHMRKGEPEKQSQKKIIPRGVGEPEKQHQMGSPEQLQKIGSEQKREDQPAAATKVPQQNRDPRIQAQKTNTTGLLRKQRPLLPKPKENQPPPGAGMPLEHHAVFKRRFPTVLEERDPYVPSPILRELNQTHTRTRHPAGGNHHGPRPDFGPVGMVPRQLGTFPQAKVPAAGEIRPLFSLNRLSWPQLNDCPATTPQLVQSENEMRELLDPTNFVDQRLAHNREMQERFLQKGQIWQKQDILAFRQIKHETKKFVFDHRRTARPGESKQADLWEDRILKMIHLTRIIANKTEMECLLAQSCVTPRYDLKYKENVHFVPNKDHALVLQERWGTTVLQSQRLSRDLINRTCRVRTCYDMAEEVSTGSLQNIADKIEVFGTLYTVSNRQPEERATGYKIYLRSLDSETMRQQISWLTSFVFSYRDGAIAKEFLRLPYLGWPSNADWKDMASTLVSVKVRRFLNFPLHQKNLDECEEGEVFIMTNNIEPLIHILLEKRVKDRNLHTGLFLRFSPALLPHMSGWTSPKGEHELVTNINDFIPHDPIATPLHHLENRKRRPLEDFRPFPTAGTFTACHQLATGIFNALKGITADTVVSQHTGFIRMNDKSN